MMAHDEIDRALFAWERAYEKTRRALTLFGNHWSEPKKCARLEAPARPCDCGLVSVVREIDELERAARQ